MIDLFIMMHDVFSYSIRGGEQRGRAVAFVAVGHRPGAARLHRQSGCYQPRSYWVSKATFWPSTNPRSPARSRVTRASSIQFSSGSHSSADLQSVHAREHSAFAAALISAFVAK